MKKEDYSGLGVKPVSRLKKRDRDTSLKMKKCYLCKGNLEESVELIIHKGKTMPLSVLKCVKCGEATSSLDDYEKVRRGIHPTILDRIKGFLGKSEYKTIDLFKGRIL